MAAKRRKAIPRSKKPKSKPRPKPSKKTVASKAQRAKQAKINAQRAAQRLKKKRSAAAKKGHETRRLKALIRERTYHVRDVERDLGVLEELRKPIEILKAPATRKEYIEHIEKLDKRLIAWHDLAGPEWVKDDGSMAREKSTLRILPIKMRNKIRKRLDRAEENDNVSDVAYEIAAEYEVPIKEVYTLWFS